MHLPRVHSTFMSLGDSLDQPVGAPVLQTNPYAPIITSRKPTFYVFWLVRLCYRPVGSLLMWGTQYLSVPSRHTVRNKFNHMQSKIISTICHTNNILNNHRFWIDVKSLIRVVVSKNYTINVKSTCLISHTLRRLYFAITFNDKKEEIWPSPMTKAPTPKGN